MLKLIKYEFRKNIITLGVMLGIAAALELYFLGSRVAERGDHVVIAMVLLCVAAFAMYISVFVMGVSSYSKELKQKSSYLIFMTPNSMLKIICSKLLFTLLTGILFAAVIVACICLNGPMLMDTLGVWEDYYTAMENMLSMAGVQLSTYYLLGGYLLLNLALEVLCFVGVAYLAVTLSATLLQNKKSRGFVSLLIFVAINYGLSKLSELYTGEVVIETVKDIFAASWPGMVQSIAVLLVTIFGSAWMLEKRVSL